MTILRFCLLAVVMIISGTFNGSAGVDTTATSAFDFSKEYEVYYSNASDTKKRRLAIVIGNSNYQDFPQLPNPKNDARDIASVLRNIGFDVTEVIDATRSQVVEAITTFSKRSNTADLVLFYYAGHAAQVNGVNYMFGVDVQGIKTEFEMQTASISLSNIFDLLESTAPVRVFILDACRDNPFVNRLSRGLEPVQPGAELNQSSSSNIAGTNSDQRLAKGLAPVRLRTGSYIAYATRPGAISFDGKDSNSPFAKAIIKHLPTRDRTIDQLFQSIRLDVVYETNGEQIPWSESSLVNNLFLAERSRETPVVASLPGYQTDDDIIITDANLKSKLAGRDLLVNGVAHARLVNDRVQFLDGNNGKDVLRRGVNSLRAAGEDFSLWYERQQLELFTRPYQKSYAIIAAVAQYPAHLNDQFPNMPFMQEHAVKLASVLVELGFPRENIITLLNEQATSVRIDAELKRFWKGGDRSDADRVLVYFGGHGSHIVIPNFLSASRGKSTSKGFLITYDYSDQSPTSTSFLLDDILQKHFALMIPRHVAFLIDSCSSGLALGSYAGESGNTPDNIKRFQQLALLDSELKSNARNLLVASTGDEQALYKNGGVLTTAAIEGLETRAADANGDGLITFAELNMFVTNEVIRKSKALGFEQRPQDFKVGGNMVFMPPIDAK
jgi:uncharacterized caspase-like protein